MKSYVLLQQLITILSEAVMSVVTYVCPRVSVAVWIVDKQKMPISFIEHHLDIVVGVVIRQHLHRKIYRPRVLGSVFCSVVIMS